MPLGVKKLAYDAIIPTRGSDGAVGYDLYSNVDTVVPHQAGNAVVGTGIALRIPSDCYGRVAPRSGLAAKVSLTLIIPVKSKSSYSIMV